MAKKIILVAASLFLIWQSVNLIMSLGSLNSLDWGQKLFLAFLINLYLTGVFAFAGFALPTQKLLPDSYYQIRNSKRLKKYYALLKVSLFRTFLLATFWKSKSQQQKYFDGKRSGLENLETQSFKSEFGHILPALAISVVIIYLVVLGQYGLGLLTLLINIIGNLYPVILQRHHRMRIDILKRRYGST